MSLGKNLQEEMFAATNELQGFLLEEAPKIDKAELEEPSMVPPILNLVGGSLHDYPLPTERLVPAR